MSLPALGRFERAKAPSRNAADTPLPEGEGQGEGEEVMEF
jgi:hypothetical protein